jgi:hypothetical protein
MVTWFFIQNMRLRHKVRREFPIPVQGTDMPVILAYEAYIYQLLLYCNVSNFIPF